MKAAVVKANWLLWMNKNKHLVNDGVHEKEKFLFYEFFPV
jgi:hypothetical protein